MQASTIKSNIERIRQRIEEACSSCGRSPSEITLVAVSKFNPAEAVDAAAACGVLDFGESRVQELTEKIPKVEADVRWHFIGHLQTNKVKNIIGRVCLVHSVDSLHLAKELDRRSAAAGVVTDILVQINAAGEESKFGEGLAGGEELARQIKGECGSLRLRGLMQIAPAAEDPEDVRIYFRQVAELYNRLKNSGFSDFDTLSMGMSHDFETAIEEGSTMIRVGTDIFGERVYK